MKSGSVDLATSSISQSEHAVVQHTLVADRTHGPVTFVNTLARYLNLSDVHIATKPGDAFHMMLGLQAHDHQLYLALFRQVHVGDSFSFTTVNRAGKKFIQVTNWRSQLGIEHLHAPIEMAVGK